MRRTIVPLLILALVWAAVALPMLGASGLTMSEGHRAIPGWEMLRTGDWLVPTMFEQAYLRKPPGMAWTTGLSAAVLGESAWSARLVSALGFGVCALAAWWFGRRWFEERGALAGGLAVLLMPWLWMVARRGEIEALLLGGTAVGAYALLDRLVWRHPGGARAVTALGVVGWTVAMLAKGPAALPVLVGCVGAACIVRRSWRPLVAPAHLLCLLVPIAVLGAWAWLAHASLRASGQSAVLQSPGEFLFEPGRLVGIGVLGGAALLAMLPASLALLFPWGPDARRESEASAGAGERYRLARAISWAVLISLGVFMLAGVSNPRYAMPTAVLPPMVVAWVVSGLGARGPAGGLLPKRAAIARGMLLGRPAVLAGLLLVGAGCWIWWGEARGRATSGEPAGRELGAVLADRLGGDRDGTIVIWADDAIEARPEVLDALVRSAGARGVAVRGIWKAGIREAGWDGARVEAGAVLLRADDGSPERGMVVKLGRDPAWTEVARVDAHKYLFALLLRESDREGDPEPGVQP